MRGAASKSPLAKVIIVRSSPPSGRDKSRIANLGRLYCERVVLIWMNSSKGLLWPAFRPSFFENIYREFFMLKHTGTPRALNTLPCTAHHQGYTLAPAVNLS